MAPMHIEPFLTSHCVRPPALEEFEAVPISFAYLPADQDPGRFVIIFLSSRCLPALLADWISLWLTKPIKDPRLKVTVGVLIGAAIAFFSMYVMEVVILLAVFAVDGITGSQDGDPLRLEEGQVSRSPT
jgi:hypothetical protein